MIMQPELFKFEPDIRLAHGQEKNTGLISRTPMPAPATSLTGHVPNIGKKVLPTFARNSETSRQAAIKKYDAGTALNQREMIYRLIRFSGVKGQTREEIAEKLELSGDTVRPRVKELLGEARNWPDPFICRNGETRKTKSGLNAEILTVINELRP